MSAPTRAHTLTLKLAADSKADLIDAIKSFLVDLERDQISIGCTGGWSWGGDWVYRVDKTMTHDAYVEALNSYLKAEAPARIEGSTT